MEIQTVSKQEKTLAKEIAKEIDHLIDEISINEETISTSYAKLGSLLLKVRDSKLWLQWEYNTFGKYLEYVQSRLNKSRSQLYQTISVAENLLPWLSESTLQDIGISKSLELSKFVKQTGKKPPTEVLNAAIDPDTTADVLRGILFEAQNIKQVKEQQSYIDLRFFATKEEKATILEALEVAAKTDPVISKELPEWVQTKEALMRLAMEYIGTYGVS